MIHPFLILLLLFSACDSGEQIGTADSVVRAQDGLLDGPISDVQTREDLGLGPLDASLDARVGNRPDILPVDGPILAADDLDLTQRVQLGRSRAGQVQSDAERLTGPEANCRIGDYRLDNHLVSVCIQGPTTFSQFSFTGGNLIDAHPAERPGTDSFREVVIAPAVGEVYATEVGVVRDGSDGGAAVVRARGQTGGSRILQGVLPNSFIPPPMDVITEYRLHPDENTVEIFTWFSLLPGQVSGLFYMYDLVYFGDLNRTFLPGRGPNNLDSPLPYVAAVGPENSYGWFSEISPFDLFIITEIGVPGAPIEYDAIALNAGDLVLLKRWLKIAHGGIEGIRPTPENAKTVTINGLAGTEVIIESPDENLVTTVKLDLNGRGLVRLAPGSYVAHTHGYAGGDIDEPFEVVDGPVVVQLAQPMPGRLHVRITNGNGTPIAAKLKMTGPTDRLEFVVDEKQILLPAGMWSIRASLGWHYSIARTAVEIVAGGDVDVDLVLNEQIPLDGLASGEFHQHASPSLDSEVAVTERVLSNIVEGVSFMAPSDHDIIYDYAGLVRRMNLTNRIGVPLTGEEISPVYAHLGAYGIPYDPYGGAGGAVNIPIKDEGEWRVHTVPELVAIARDKGARAIQVNHPRASQGYFDHVGYHAGIPIDDLDSTEFSPDFDSIEVFNGGSDFCQVLNDWMGLLNQGHRSTAVGNSDTHRRHEAPGYPRNYLATLAPNPAFVTADEIVDSLVNGRMTIGGDAVMDFPGGVQPGQTVRVSDGAVTVSLRLRTPDYTALDRIIVLINGVAIRELQLNAPLNDIIDFEDAISFEINSDSHAVFLAIGTRRSPDTDARPIFALSNPIWFDADGDGITPVGVGDLPKLQLPFCR
ncbi:MAG: CehA/McbA family metallohydrolase [Myxococcota bacterium]|nr:CehA/McbA family metallohydrolase [Myxococcota bacterium]